MTEEMLVEALARVISAETLEEAQAEAMDALFEFEFPDEDTVLL